MFSLSLFLSLSLSLSLSLCVVPRLRHHFSSIIRAFYDRTFFQAPSSANKICFQALPVNIGHSGNNGMIGGSTPSVLPTLPTVPVSTLVLNNPLAESKY